jgi:antitoxin MazE
MVQKIRNIGNSNGVIIPKSFLKACDIQDSVKIELKDGSIIITPVKGDPRKGWDEQFERAIANGELPDENEFESVTNEFDEDEW